MQMITTQTFTVKYDFDPDYIWSDISGVINESGVEPLKVIVHNDLTIDNVEMVFVNRDHAIRFTECYLDSDDPADIKEYVGPNF
jgi:hypothetical protein